MNYGHKELKIITESAKETKKLGENLAKEILRDMRGRVTHRPVSGLASKAIAIGLEGELGSGKTTFVQGLAKGFGIKKRITSPTFVIMKKYKIPAAKYQLQNTNFYHFDCYRLSGPKDLMDLGFKEIINEPKNIAVIEWAERVKKILPKDSSWIKFGHLAQNKRKVAINMTRGYAFWLRKNPQLARRKFCRQNLGGRGFLLR